MIDKALTLLPQPDSPTRPNASPSLRVNETPLTALTTPSGVKNWVRRSFTARSGGPVLGCGMALLPEPVGGSVTDPVGGGLLAGRVQVDQQQAHQQDEQERTGRVAQVLSGDRGPDGCGGERHKCADRNLSVFDK